MRGIKIIFNDEEIHTGNDLDLVQEEKKIEKPKIQSHTVEVPGRNGLLNLTKGLTGRVMYYNRTLSFRYFGTGARSRLLELDTLLSRYHGQTIRIVDDDYPDHYYEGEASVETELKGNYIIISLTVDAQPFRLKTEPTVYEMDVDHDDTTPLSVTLLNEDIDAIPIIEVGVVPGLPEDDDYEATIVYGDFQVTLSKGVYSSEKITLHRGTNTIKLYGFAYVTFTYQEGAI